jgi:NTE family protein
MKEINKLIFSGGGSRGLCYIGVIRCFEEMVSKGLIKINIKEICGVSIGSVVGLLYVLGYSYEELFQEIMKSDMSVLKELKLRNFLTKYGLDSGKKFMLWVEGFIIKKGFSRNITFKQLWLKTGINLKIVASNLNKYSLEIFDYEKNPNLKILKAIKMSLSVPFLFSPEKYKDNYYVDGGLINNFPIELYKNDIQNVLGCKIVNNGELEKDVNIQIDSFESYAMNVFNCYFGKREEANTRSCEYFEYIIDIKAHNIDFMNFNLTDSDKIYIINVGYDAACNYFKRIDIENV